MSIERNRWGFDGEITFECDECGEELHTDTTDFGSARKRLKDEGWTNKLERGDWTHLCPSCQDSENDNELLEDFGQ